MTDDDHGGTDSLRDWIDRLEAFASSLGDIEGESATDFADNTLEALQNLALPHATGVNLSALVIFEGLNALANKSTDVFMDGRGACSDRSDQASTPSTAVGC